MSNEALQSQIESELEKAKSNIQLEFKEIKLELEKQRAINSELLLQTKNKIEIAKSEISETAVNKVLEILNHVRNWIGIIALIIGLGTFLGYKSFVTHMTEYFKSEVDKWLRLDDQESDGKKALDQLRTQAILDAHSIRLARSMSNSYGVHTSELSESETRRLLEIVINPKTDHGDFIDALRLLTINRMPFSILRPNDETGEKITALLSSEKHDMFKKGEILTRMENDESLVKYSKAILNDPSADESIKVAALKNISHFDKSLAIKFSKENINTFIQPNTKLDLAKLLSQEAPDSEEIYKYLNSLEKSKDEDWKADYAILNFQLIQSTKIPATQKKEAIFSFADLIADGMQLTLTDSMFGSKYVAIEIENRYITLDEPKTFLSDENLISQIINSRTISAEWLKTVTRFFEISEKDYYLTTLVMTPSPATKFILENSSTITSEDILDHVWIKINFLAGDEYLSIIWRDKNGLIHKEILKDISVEEPSSFMVSFDDDVLSNLSARQFNKKHY